MKIFTHNFVIYRNGWVMKWEKKTEPFMSFNLAEIFILLLILMVVL